MAADLGLLSLNHHQKSTHHSQTNHQNPILTTDSWMWNPNQPQDDDDSWEVRAFAEDTGNIMGTTWPPRSYTCAFCRREFRSAQALGGHMNVHRRDRARLHQTQLGTVGAINIPTASSSSNLILPAGQEFATSSGLCLLYQLPNTNGVFPPAGPVTACTIDSSSTFPSISPHPSNNLIGIGPSTLNFPVASPVLNSSPSTHHNSSKAEPSSSSRNDANNSSTTNNNNNEAYNMEDIDLELRLGHRPTRPPP
ncbi:hypothetical protein SLE2022_225260 [Rubroshorea leprosula]